MRKVFRIGLSYKPCRSKEATKLVQGSWVVGPLPVFLFLLFPFCSLSPMKVSLARAVVGRMLLSLAAFLFLYNIFTYISFSLPLDLFSFSLFVVVNAINLINRI